MLVLTRKQGESIDIDTGNGKWIRVKVLRIGNAVRLGVEAPAEVKVIRSELSRDDEEQSAA